MKAERARVYAEAAEKRKAQEDAMQKKREQAAERARRWREGDYAKETLAGDARADATIIAKEINNVKATIDGVIEELRQVALQFLKQYAPPQRATLEYVDTLLAKVAKSGRSEDAMITELDRQYGARPEFNLQPLERARNTLAELEYQLKELDDNVRVSACLPCACRA